VWAGGKNAEGSHAGGRDGRKGRGCGRATALGEEQQQLGEKGAASAWWTIDAEDSIGLLRIMIAISYQVLLIPEFCPGGQRLTCGPTLSTNQMRPWD